jgi:hypothetical protein
MLPIKTMNEEYIYIINHGSTEALLRHEIVYLPIGFDWDIKQELTI